MMMIITRKLGLEIINTVKNVRVSGPMVVTLVVLAKVRIGKIYDKVLPVPVGAEMIASLWLKNNGIEYVCTGVVNSFLVNFKKFR